MKYKLNYFVFLKHDTVYFKKVLCLEFGMKRRQELDGTLYPLNKTQNQPIMYFW